jgi:hypothetical protein
MMDTVKGTVVKADELFVRSDSGKAEVGITTVGLWLTTAKNLPLRGVGTTWV